MTQNKNDNHDDNRIILDSQYPLFITSDLSAKGTLPDEESHHAIHVLRKKVGDTINITNGKGIVSMAVIEKITKKEVLYRVIESFDIPKPSGKLYLAVAPTKNIDRFEYMVEKCTEIGFDALYPIICEKSERKIVKPERIERIVFAAVKQSLKAHIPTIYPPTEFADFIQKVAALKDKRYIAVCHHSPRKHLFTALDSGFNSYIVIGPEGDFSPQEIQLALNNNFQPVSLGESRLRTETAAIVASLTFNLKQTLAIEK